MLANGRKIVINIVQYTFIHNIVRNKHAIATEFKRTRTQLKCSIYKNM